MATARKSTRPVSASSKGRQEKLSRAQILENALALTRRNGVSFSMRDLANELGVWPMAVYRYYKNRDELLEDIVDSVIEEVLEPSVLARLNNDHQSEQARMREFTSHLYDVIVRYPGISQQFLYGSTYSKNRFKLVGVYMDFMTKLGLSARRAAEVVHSVSLLVFQAATLEYAAERGDSSLDKVKREVEENMDPRLASAEVVDVFLNTSRRERALRGVDMVIAAVSAELDL
ncbi:MAG: TetR/AcrR family transcriptional regulator [Pseudomonadota bacterium]